MKINVQFDRTWFFSADSHMAAVSQLVSLIRDRLDRDTLVVDKSLNECTLEMSDKLTPQEVNERVSTLILENICTEELPRQPFALRILGEEQPAPLRPAPEMPGQPQPDPEREPEAPEAPGALEQIDALVGAAAFKRLAHEIHDRAPRIRRNGTEAVFLSEVYLFSGNEGCGCDKAAGLLAALLEEEQLFHAEASPYQLKLAPPPKPMSDAFLDRILDSPRVLTVDLSAVIELTHTAEFKAFLKSLFAEGEKSLILLRAPYLVRSRLEQVAEDVRDVLSLTPVAFPPFSDEELCELARRDLARYSFTAAQDAWPIFLRRVARESQDGYFYGAHTVRKLTNEMIRAAERLPETAEREISAAALAGFVTEAEEEQQPGLAQLDGMVGMQRIAQQVRELINMVVFARKDPTSAAPGMHMCFTGNPGTGKTTVARIIGQALKEAGILRIGKFHEHHARDLCGQYVGQTAPLTASICRDSYGSVLFLDEAYSLSYSDSSRDYGQEAITALIAEMENHRDDLLVIFAGYPEEMEQFLDANPGLRTRIPYHLRFPNYSREELYEIFCGMVRRFRLSDGFLPHAQAYFRALPDAVLEERSFGNGRFVRNLYERVWSKAAMRCSGCTPDELVLEPDDLDAAAADMPEARQVRDRPRIGF